MLFDESEMPVARKKRIDSDQEANPLRVPYERLKKIAASDFGGEATSNQIIELVRISLTFLNEMALPIELISKVPGKEYISYSLKTGPSKLSSPINKALFNPNTRIIESEWKSWKVGESPMGLAVLTYTMATVYRAASELFDRSNRKGPATYFEILIGHLVARDRRHAQKREDKDSGRGAGCSSNNGFFDRSRRESSPYSHARQALD